MSEAREEPAAPAPATEAQAPSEAPSPAAAAPAVPEATQPPAEDSPSTSVSEAAAPPQLENLLSGAPGERAPAETLVEPVAPEPAAAPVYEWQPFTLPESLQAAPLDEERLGQLRETLTASDLSPQERGQRLLDLHIAEMRAYDERVLERQVATFQDMQRGWIDRFKGDPEIGGAAAQTHLALANAAIRRFAQEDQRHGRPLSAASNGAARESDHSALMDALRVTGAVNHPEIVRYLARVEAFMREPARAAPALGASAVPRDIGNRRPSAQGGNPGRGAPRMRDMYDHPRSGDVFNGSPR